MVMALEQSAKSPIGRLWVKILWKLGFYQGKIY